MKTVQPTRDTKTMIREFVRLPEFEKQCKQIGLDEDDIQEIENALLLDPATGDVMKDTGGLRKFRIALLQEPKSNRTENYSKIYWYQ